jgi:AcrR family transcriptional regulator
VSGRPRSERARQAILAAAIELLLEHGVQGTSVYEVARRADVSKATIYRWWPSKELLALDALAADWEPAPAAAGTDGPLRDDLLDRLRPWLRRLRRRPYGRVVAGLVAEAQADPAFAELYRARVLAPRRDAARAVFAAALERGELPASTDLELALDLLYGPIYHRLLHGHAPLTERFATDVVDGVLAAVGARSGTLTA